jgi:uncharacterized membrane protein YgaE (UPF0421/DUF939 family)
MFLAQTLHLSQDYWAAVSAVIVMQSGYDATLKAGLSRMAGTAIGALVVVPFAELASGNLGAFAAAVVITILVCASLNLEDSQRLAAATVAIIMLIPHSEAAWRTGIFRFLEVSIGIISALAVARLIWPGPAGNPNAAGPRETDKRSLPF